MKVEAIELLGNTYQPRKTKKEPSLHPIRKVCLRFLPYHAASMIAAHQSVPTQLSDF